MRRDLIGDAVRGRVDGHIRDEAINEPVAILDRFLHYAITGRSYITSWRQGDIRNRKIFCSVYRG